MAIPVLPSGYAPAPPQVVRDRIPASEHPALIHIMDLVASLGRYERQFHLALMLFDLVEVEQNNIVHKCETGALSFEAMDSLTNTLGGWKKMAARDGAFAIYHFGQALLAFSSSFNLCLALKGQMDLSQMRIARKLFLSQFPGYDSIRHVVGHVADFSATMHRRRKHSVRGRISADFGPVGLVIEDADAVTQFTDNLYHRTYFVSYEGKMYRYDLSEQTLSKIRQIRKAAYSGFDRATMPNP
jgi:hypothetical protein